MSGERDPKERVGRQSPGFDPWLFGATVVLAAFGLVMVYSASAVYALDKFGSDTHFAVRQMVFLLVGLGVLYFAQRVDYHWFKRASRPLLILSLLLLLLVLLPGLGTRVGGAQRWFRIGPVSLQPSELAKIALVLYLGTLLSDRRREVARFWSGFAAPLSVVGLITGLTLLQPDLGTAVLLGLSAVLMLFVAGTRLLYIVVAAMLAAPVVWFSVVGTPWRLKRLMAFFDPEAHRQGAGYQVWEALVTTGSGGLSGVGLGEGQQKLFYLPEAHTDFILAVIGQELGFVGFCLTLLLFAVILWRGTRVALRARDRFGTFLAFGFTGMLAFQACINMAVVVGVLPTKGITLPFVSYGGSSLLSSFFMTGIVLGISRGQRVAAPARPRAWGFKDRSGEGTAPRLQAAPAAPVRVRSGGVWRAFGTRGPTAAPFEQDLGGGGRRPTDPGLSGRLSPSEEAP